MIFLMPFHSKNNKKEDLHHVYFVQQNVEAHQQLKKKKKLSCHLSILR